MNKISEELWCDVSNITGVVDRLEKQGLVWRTPHPDDRRVSLIGIIVPEGFHFSGIRNQYYIINQVGSLNIFGISFFPAGLYPFLKTPLSEFVNNIVELDIIINEFTSKIEEKLITNDSIPEKINIIEKELIQLIDIRLIPTNEFNQIYNYFYSNINDMRINNFCEQYGINQHKLERIFNKYIGISPKLFYKINRFQRVVNQMIKKKHVNLVSLAHENGYYDQTHFIRDFKSFTGCSPSQFLYEKRSIKEILEHS